MNLTINGAYRSNNNLVRIRSAQLAGEYLAEFDEMFVESRFGAGSPAGGSHPVISLDGDRVEVYFSPDDGALERLLELVEGAQQSVYFLAYSFTDDDLAEALLERAGEGVAVAGVMDAGQARSNTGSEYDTFLKHGLDVRLDGAAGSMHHKVIVIDAQVVVTGSYNFSQNARTRNDENTLVIHSKSIAGLFLEEFQRIFSTAQRQ
jgi:phosphatidylserine/phosphatidylglycerophosphate/cardiolipin synthase-like enzyme